VTINYFPVGPDGPSDRLQNRVVDNYLRKAQCGENPASTRGFALALGYLPARLLAPSPLVLESVIATLSKVGRHTALVGNEKDAETRRNALIALRRVSQTVGLEAVLRKNVPLATPTTNVTGLDSNLVSLVFEAFLRGLDDYNVDRRGDIGSWCRIASMKGLVAIVGLVVEQASQDVLCKLWSPNLATKVIACMLKQFSEKLDFVRVEAGACLERLLAQNDPEIPGIPEKEYLRQCLGVETKSDDLHASHLGTSNWADAALTFPMVAKAAQVAVYFPAIIAGMVISVGGLTESIAKESNTALIQLAREATGSPRIIELSNGRFLPRRWRLWIHSFLKSCPLPSHLHVNVSLLAKCCWACFVRTVEMDASYSLC
jgi:tubulin-specific chaperone D